MKTKLTMDLEVKMGNANTTGTGCVGYLPEGTTYKQLVKAFGKPQRLGLSEDGKTEAEWTGRINGLDFTIYDYKSGLAAKANTDWHIGGKVHVVAELVNAYFRVAVK